MELEKIDQIGKCYKNMSLCGREEKMYKCDIFILEFNDTAKIHAIGYIDNDGFYFNIWKVYKNGKNYRNSRYFTKYVTLVRDNIFNYYNK